MCAKSKLFVLFACLLLMQISTTETNETTTQTTNLEINNKINYSNYSKTTVTTELTTKEVETSTAKFISSTTKTDFATTASFTELTQDGNSHKMQIPTTETNEETTKTTEINIITNDSNYSKTTVKTELATKEVETSTAKFISSTTKTDFATTASFTELTQDVNSHKMQIPTTETNEETTKTTEINIKTNDSNFSKTTVKTELATKEVETSTAKFVSSTTTKYFDTTAPFTELTHDANSEEVLESKKNVNILSTLEENELKPPNNELTNDTEETNQVLLKNKLKNNNSKSITSVDKEISDNSLQSEDDNNPCKLCQQDVNLSGFRQELALNEVKLFWNDIDNQEGCQYKYTTEMIQVQFNFTRFYKHTGVNISTRTMCGTHVVKISAMNDCGNSVAQSYNVFFPLDTFDISVIQTSSNSTTVNVTFSDQRENCPLPQLNIQCSGEDSEEYSNTFKGFQGGRLLLDGLVPFTNYSCAGEYFNQDESVGNSTFTVKTAQAAPSAVRNLAIHNVTESGLNVSWSIPETIHGVLTEYRIDVFGEALYDLPKFCRTRIGGIYSISRIINQNLKDGKLNEYFGDLPSNYGYRITVQAKTVDYGSEVTKSASTKTPPPKEIENLVFTIDTQVENKPVAHLRWSYPCSTNASANKVLFNIHFAQDIPNQINKSLSEDDDLENLTIDLSLRPSTNYTIMVYTINLETNVTSVIPKILKIQSPKGNTSEPLNLTIDLEDHWIIGMHWEKPRVMFGDFVHYQINITLLAALHEVLCKDERMDYFLANTSHTNLTVQNFVSPHRKYRIEITAVTAEGPGDILQQELSTKSIQSQPPQNVLCDAADPGGDGSVTVHYQQPCDFNGVFDHYLITLIDEQGRQQRQTREKGLSHRLEGLKPEMQYKAIVVVVNDETRSIESYCEFKMPADIPEAPVLREVEVITEVHDKEVTVMLRDDYFEDSHGVVRYFALLVGIAELWDDKQMQESQTGYWNGKDWPNNEFWNEQGMTYQATPDKWDPFKASKLLSGAIKNFTFKLGTDNCTGKVNQFCNGPLLPNTEYYLAIRGYTTNGYRTSNSLSFLTDDDVTKTHNVVLIIGVLAGVLLVSTLAGIGCIYWKRRPSKPTSLEEANQIVNTAVQQEILVPNPVKIEDFCAFYNDRKMFLCDEYEALAKFGADFDRNIGGQPENRKKNRYINILPYDCSRVPLEGCKNDYINASFIKGYSGEVDYIATQGPLESTTADFWMMVMNQNCSVVAMVAQFEEHKKTKCHRYFPECREQMELYLDDGGEMMVRCAYALNFDYYIERQIIVQACGKQLAVTHLQFLNWPDFGCPDGTTNMLQFTKRLRRHMDQNESKAVIHCSAGVGRTGTIVAVDILLQTIRDEKEINIFGIVAALREQRTKMVQAESQYLYIYQCILDHILQPIELTEIKPIDPIYENMENLIEMKVLATQNNNCDTQIEYFTDINEQSSEKEAKSDKTINDEQNEINTKKNEETKV